MWNGKLAAASIHLALSLAIAALVAAFVFLVWYPSPYDILSKGTRLFLLIVAVDVSLGPLITLVVFNCNKPRRELRWDLTVVAALQLGALAYGLWTVAIARPVALVFEIDRFRIVHAADIDPAELSKAPPEASKLPLMGRMSLAVRPFANSSESFDATFAALQGIHIAFRPEFWIPLEKAKPQLRAKAAPLSALERRLPGGAEALRLATEQAKHAPEDLLYLPVVGRNEVWTALLDKNTLEILGFIPIDTLGIADTPGNQQSR